MNFLIALLFLALGPATYIPMSKAKAWSWDHKWLLQGLFAWIIVPWISAVIALSPTDISLLDIFKLPAVFPIIGYGVLWGIGCLTFGLSIRYLGFALGQSLALGICSAFGTLYPVLAAGTDLFNGSGFILLIAVCISLLGITLVGFAAGLRSKQLNDSGLKTAVKEFSLLKGIFVAVLAGVTSSCFNLGLEAGQPIREMLLKHNTNPDFTLHPVVLLVCIGAFLSNAAYSIFRITTQKSVDKPQSHPLKVVMISLLLCVLSGIMFNPQFYFLSIVKNFFSSDPTVLALIWSIFMSIGVIFSNLWGIVMKEWKGINIKTLLILLTGIGVLIFSIVFPQLIK